MFLTGFGKTSGFWQKPYRQVKPDRQIFAFFSAGFTGFPKICGFLAILIFQNTILLHLKSFCTIILQLYLPYILMCD
jgi:hypothetical protein